MGDRREEQTESENIREIIGELEIQVIGQGSSLGRPLVECTNTVDLKNKVEEGKLNNGTKGQWKRKSK